MLTGPQAAHTLGVVGLEHLPVPAPPQRPNLGGMSKDHLQVGHVYLHTHTSVQLNICTPKHLNTCIMALFYLDI